MTDDPDSPSFNVIVRVEDETWLRDLPQVEALCREAALAALAHAGVAGAKAGAGELGLLLTDDAAVQALNRDYRGHDRPTNVLAFGLGEPAKAAVSGDPPVLLGDVVLARQTLQREAAEQAKAPRDHLRHLVVHGVLHLLGFDHQAEAAATEMEAAEVAILAGLGVADPYGRGQPAGSLAGAAS